MTFIFMALTLYVVRHVIDYLFSPSDELSAVVHFLDLYGNLLALIGFFVWMTLGAVMAIIRRIRGIGEDDDEDEEEDENPTT